MINIKAAIPSTAANDCTSVSAATSASLSAAGLTGVVSASPFKATEQTIMVTQERNCCQLCSNDPQKVCTYRMNPTGRQPAKCNACLYPQRTEPKNMECDILELRTVAEFSVACGRCTHSQTRPRAKKGLNVYVCTGYVFPPGVSLIGTRPRCNPCNTSGAKCNFTDEVIPEPGKVIL